MKAFRIGLTVAIGVVWVLFAPQNFLVRYVAMIAVLVAVYWTTRLIFGEAAADSDPLAADPVPSLSLAERAFEDARRERA